MWYNLFKRVDKYVVMVIFLIITAMILPVTCKLFSFLDIWIQITGAVLGIVFAAVITSVMLKWQTRTETEKERDSKVYEQKILVCLEFLKEIGEILKDGKVSAEEANKLRFDFANIAIHLSEDSLIKISDSLGLIVESCGCVGEEASGLERHVMDIITVFRKEMYGSQHSTAALELIANNLSRIANQVEESSPTDSSGSTPASDNHELLDALAQQLQQQVSKDWDIRTTDGTVEIRSRLEPWNTEEQLIIRLTRDAPDFYYFQCHVNLPEEHAKRRNLYMPMRAELGGRLNKYCWWRRLNERFEGLLISGARSESDTSELLAWLVQELVRIISYTERFLSTDSLMRDFQEQTDQPQWGWSVWGNQGILVTHRSIEGVVCDFVCHPDGRYKAVRLRMQGMAPEHRQHWLASLGLPKTEAESVMLAGEVPDKEKMAELLRKLTSAFPLNR